MEQSAFETGKRNWALGFFFLQRSRNFVCILPVCLGFYTNLQRSDLKI